MVKIRKDLIGNTLDVSGPLIFGVADSTSTEANDVEATTVTAETTNGSIVLGLTDFTTVDGTSDDNNVTAAGNYVIIGTGVAPQGSLAIASPTRGDTLRLINNVAEDFILSVTGSSVYTTGNTLVSTITLEQGDCVVLQYLGTIWVTVNDSFTAA